MVQNILMEQDLVAESVPNISSIVGHAEVARLTLAGRT